MNTPEEWTERDLPPPVPPAEMPEEELRQLVDEGNLEALERALREQAVRVPNVLSELDRVLDAGLGNLAVAMATMLLSRFHLAQANELAARVLEQSAYAGIEELADLGAALMQQDRLRSATQVLEAALTKDAKHGRSLYLRSRIAARRGDFDRAFDFISRVSPNVLAAEGLLVQARYALLLGRGKASEGALRAAKKAGAEELENEWGALMNLKARVEAWDGPLDALDLRHALFLDSGALLLETSTDKRDGGRFGLDRLPPGDAGRLIHRIKETADLLGLPMNRLFFATEDGEIVAAAIHQIAGIPYRAFAAELELRDGDWLCMGSASTHPHLPNRVVRSLHEALDHGLLRSLSLVLPCGSRGPVVPDLVGRITGDDELPWLWDDEVDDAVEAIFDEEASDEAEFDSSQLARFGPSLRACQSLPRPAHAPYTDEIAVPRASPHRSSAP